MLHVLVVPQHVCRSAGSRKGDTTGARLFLFAFVRTCVCTLRRVHVSGRMLCVILHATWLRMRQRGCE